MASDPVTLAAGVDPCCPVNKQTSEKERREASGGRSRATLRTATNRHGPVLRPPEQPPHHPSLRDLTTAVQPRMGSTSDGSTILKKPWVLIDISWMPKERLMLSCDMECLVLGGE